VVSLVNDRKTVDVQNTAVAMRVAFGADKDQWLKFLHGEEDGD
jgi:hypothetical protein